MRALDDPSEVILYLNLKDGLVRTVDHSLPSASPRLRVKYPSASPRLRVNKGKQAHAEDAEDAEFT